MKHFVLFAIFLTAAGLANANLVPQNVMSQNSAVILHQDIQYTATPDNAQTVLKTVNIHTAGNLVSSGPVQTNSKIDSMYSRLFGYVSHINPLTDHESLATFWKGTLISNVIDAVIAQKQVEAIASFSASLPEISQIAANSLNDTYTNELNHVNEVPLPAAAWLFTSAIILFGFSRRNNI